MTEDLALRRHLTCIEQNSLLKPFLDHGFRIAYSPSNFDTLPPFSGIDVVALNI